MAAGRRTILMVEDEESTVPLAEALEREGFDTRVTGTVREALESTEKALPTWSCST